MYNLLRGYNQSLDSISEYYKLTIKTGIIHLTAIGTNKIKSAKILYHDQFVNIILATQKTDLILIFYIQQVLTANKLEVLIFLEYIYQYPNDL